ncbi:probable E3 ubiquitin-protein ligase ZFP1 [Solanum lycopersicum]|uniref:probable E3 ubiquitin-protein ligase ZFP1 n=1 Tax=Solanum lycopersicum TaxID=4081 RepID=UPI0002BC932E|nr:probable E3 ubiquitin-protein ligase ZFP1 [Solanum lycopersicum]
MCAYRQTHRSNHTRIHSSFNYRNHQQQQRYNQRNQQSHQQRGYNQHNQQIHHQQQRGYNPRPDNQPSRRHNHNDDNNSHENHQSSAEPEYSPGIPSISPYSHIDDVFESEYSSGIPSISPYSQIDDVFGTLPIEFNRISGELFHDVHNLFHRLNSEFLALYDDDDDVLKHLKTRTHHVVAKDEIDTELAEVESNICSICLSVYENEENIGALQCGHEYHTDCIKPWLLKKNDCPLCRGSVL